MSAKSRVVAAVSCFALAAGSCGGPDAVPGGEPTPVAATSSAVPRPPPSRARCDAVPPVHCSRDGFCVENPWPTANRLRAVAGWSARDVIAVGERGTALRFDGARWTMLDAGTDVALVDAWGSGPGEALVLAASGELLHRDGPRLVPLAGAPAGAFTAIAGTGSDDVWLGGREGVLARFDGARWTSVDAGVRADVLALWVAAPGEAWIGFASGDVVRFEGGRPRAVRGAGDAVRAIAGSGARDVLVASRQGSVHRFDGARWAEHAHPGPSVGSLASPRVGEAYATAGDRVMRFDGRGWALEPDVLPARAATHLVLEDVWATGDDVVAVGWAGSLVRKARGAWVPSPTVTLADLSAVWGATADDVWAGGERVLLHWDGCAWRLVPEVGSAHGIWGSSAHDVFVVGDGGAIRHHDGATWSLQPSGTKEALRAVWGRGPTEVYAVGNRGVVLRFDGSRWSSLPSPTVEDLTSVAITPGGELLVAHRAVAGGPVFRFDGRRWSREQIAPAGIGVVPAADGAVHLALSGAARRGASGWRAVPAPLPSSGFAPRAAWADASELVVVGAAGRVHRLREGRWVAEDGGIDVDLRAVWSSAGVVIAVGDHGTILRQDPRRAR